MRDLIATLSAVPAPGLVRTRPARVAVRTDRRPLIALASLVGASAAIRAVFAVKHSVPHYFPDEYVYAALGRALAHGNLEVRGTTTHFPQILAPLVAAPFWRLFSTTTAYHLIQVENAVFASLAAIPVYLLARWLTLGRRYAFFCAAVAVALPDLVFSGLVVSDPVAYPLILTTILVGVTAIEAPSLRRQLAFLALASLSVLARIEYSVVVVAYVAAATVVERRRVFRVHWLAFAAVVPGVAAVLAGATSYYLARGGLGSLDIRIVPLAHWFVLQGFLLAVVSGVVIVPGAVAALLRPSGRREVIYAVFTLSFSVLVLGAASHVAAQTTHFKERYLFAIVPLLAVAFGTYLRRHPLRPLVLVLAAAIAIALAELPLSSYTAATFKGDSPFLQAVWNLQVRMDTASASLLVAVVATAGCVLAVAVAFGVFRWAALTFVLLFLVAASVFATVEDLGSTRAVRGVLPADLTWVDHTKPGLVTAVATTSTPSFELRETLFWNPSIQREVVLPGAYATDLLETPQLRLGPDGALLNVRGDVLFDDSGAVGALAHAQRVAGVPGFTLWRPHGKPRLQLLIDNRYFDGWLGAGGRIRAWPVVRGQAATVSFTVSVPRRWQTVRLRLGAATVVVGPRRSRRVTCRSASGHLDIPYSSPDLRFGSMARLVIARMTNLSVADVRPERRLGSACHVVG